MNNNRLKQCRNNAGLTLKQAGEKIGISNSTLSLYETGHRTPDIVTVMRIASVYNVSIDYLMGVSDGKEQSNVQPIPQNQMDDRVVSVLKDLSDQQIQTLVAFAAGMKAARK